MRLENIEEGKEYYLNSPSFLKNGSYIKVWKVDLDNEVVRFTHARDGSDDYCNRVEAERISELEKEEAVVTTFVEVFSATAKFRWLTRVSSGATFIAKEERVLQQMHQGMRGTQKWEDIEEVNEKDL
tara:strand:- start:32 stop:412 length:381 start_codon:yes stop_codon:yes gene_type:complete